MSCGNNQISLRHICMLKHINVCSAAANTLYIVLVHNCFKLWRIVINNRYVVVLVAQAFCQSCAQLACSDNYYIHYILLKHGHGC